MIESVDSLRYVVSFKEQSHNVHTGEREFRCCRKKLLVFGNCKSGRPWSTRALSATLWEKRHLVSLPIILWALCRSIFPHQIVFASQLTTPSQAIQSS